MLLAPDIVEAILNGRAGELGLPTLLDPFQAVRADQQSAMQKENTRGAPDNIRLDGTTASWPELAVIGGPVSATNTREPTLATASHLSAFCRSSRLITPLLARDLTGRRAEQIQGDLIVLPKPLDESASLLITERRSRAPKDLIDRPRTIDGSKDSFLCVGDWKGVVRIGVCRIDRDGCGTWRYSVLYAHGLR